MAGWDDAISSNLPGAPRRPKPPPGRGLMADLFPVDPRQVLGGLYDLGARGVGHAVDWATGQPYSEDFSTPTPGREAYSALTSPTFGGGMSPMAAAPMAMRAARTARTAEEAVQDAAAAARGSAANVAARGAVSTPGQAALDQMVQQSAAEAAKPPGIIAYHGSPYTFDKFDASKIGTGEGVQAYGHGLYFAEAEPTAQSYRPRGMTYEGEPVGQSWRTSALEYLDPRIFREKGAQAAIDEAKTRMADMAEFYRSTNLDQGPNLYDHALAGLNEVDPSKIKQAGATYQVRINADPSQMLDWDKPLSEQPDILKALQQNTVLDVNPTWTGEDYYKEMVSNRQILANDLPIGDAAARDASRARSASAVSQRLQQQADIPGIKYLDQGSRAAGEGSRNYVVFDPATIEILKRYGLYGALAPVGAGAATFGVLGQQGPGTTLNSPPPRLGA